MISLLNTTRCRDKATACSVTSLFPVAQDTHQQTKERKAIIQLYDTSSQWKQQQHFSLSLEGFHWSMKNHKNCEILSGRFYKLLIRPYSDAISKLTFNTCANGAKRGWGTRDSEVTFIFITLKRALIVIARFSEDHG